MSIKDFFNPTKRKVLIYIILFIIGFLFFLFSMSYICTGALPGDKPKLIPNFCGHEWMSLVYAMFSWPIILANMIVTKTPGWPLTDYIYSTPFLILQFLIYPYFIACLIDWLFKKK